MRIPDPFNRTSWFSLVPGLGHLAIGARGRGVRLLVFTMAMLVVLACRWKPLMETFATPHVDRWFAALFAVGSLAACVVYSILDVHMQGTKSPRQGLGRSPYKVAIRRFRENRLAVMALDVIAVLYVVAILAPLLAPHDPAAISDVLQTRYLAPSWEHPFGTDEFGRDLFSRALYGARVSLSVGLLAVAVAISLGTVYGAVAGYVGGIIDSVMMRFVDVLLAFPTFFLMLMLAGVFDANLGFLVIILGLTSWPGTARFIRAEMLSLKEREFTEAARAMGLPPSNIIFRHLIPNAMSPVLVSAALMIGGMIAAEASLSFLGIGIQPPTPSWGNLVSDGQDALMVAWWIAFFPGSLLAITVICFNLLADGLRDALDPKTLMRRLV